MRTVLPLTPAVVSLLLLAAHFLRAGRLGLMTISLLLLSLIAIRRPAAGLILQMALILGALEWLRTLWSVAGARMDAGRPWARFALILGMVILVHLLAALLLRSHALRRWYRMSGS